MIFFSCSSAVSRLNQISLWQKKKTWVWRLLYLTCGNGVSWAMARFELLSLAQLTLVWLQWDVYKHKSFDSNCLKALVRINIHTWATSSHLVSRSFLWCISKKRTPPWFTCSNFCDWKSPCFKPKNKMVELADMSWVIIGWCQFNVYSCVERVVQLTPTLNIFYFCKLFFYFIPFFTSPIILHLTVKNQNATCCASEQCETVQQRKMQ